MSDPALRTEVRKVSPHISVIDIHGSVTRAGEATLTSAYNEAGANGVRSIVLNFQGLEYMNSSGIGLLVTMLVRANRQGQQLYAYGLTEHYQDIFAVTRLSEAIHIYPDESAVMEAASRR